MEVIIKEIVTGKFEYDTAICECGLQVVVNKGSADKFVGKKVKIKNGVITEIAETINDQLVKPLPTNRSKK
jgi:hypothetical protein